jgi:hypothetical protein
LATELEYGRREVALERWGLRREATENQHELDHQNLLFTHHTTKPKLIIIN